jgi:Mg2+-importing ATPase
MISMALATPLLPFLPMAAKQILLNNFLSDIPSIAISSDNVDRGRLARPQAWSIGAIGRFMLLFGLVSSAFDVLTFAVLLFVFEAGEPVFQTCWFVASLLTELAVVLVLRTSGPAFRSRPGRMLLWSTTAVAAAALAIPFLGAPATAFGFVPLTLPQATAILAIVAGYAAATEAAKLWFSRGTP